MNGRLIFLALLFSVHTFSQDREDSLLKELADKACECVDSIDLYNRIKKEVIAEIHSCIDEQTGAYQMGSKLFNIDYSDAFVKDGKKEVNIQVNLNKDSEDYKSYYYKIERYLMYNCEALEVAISSNEAQSEKSVSSNSEALRYYSLGFQEAKSENCEKAITYYKEAVRIDPEFAFAWDNMGICYRRLGKYDDAIEAYQKSLLIDPYGIMPLQNIAIVYQYTEEYEKAIDAYERYGAIHKNNPEYYYGAGRVYAIFLNQYEKGLDYMCKAFNLYVQEKSPYRTDAEQVILIIHSEMEKLNQHDKFLEILRANNIEWAD